MQQISSSEFAPETTELPPAIPLAQQRRLDWLRHPSSALRQTIFLFAITRFLFLLITYFGYVLFNVGKYSPSSAGVGNLLRSWYQWDATWFLGIVAGGYSPANFRQTAFFPLYPLLVKGVSLPLGNPASFGAYYAAGLLVSNIASFLAFWALRALTERECGSEVAARAVTYLAVFPTALYLFAPYNESLFLLLTILCFLALRSGRWWLAGVIGLLAALTRSVGLFLVIPFLIEYLSQHGWQWWHLPFLNQHPSQPGWQWQQLRLGWLAVGLIPGGIALYAGYLWLHLGHPLLFVHIQTSWGRLLTWPWVGVEHQLLDLWRVAPASFFQAHDLLDLAALIGFLTLIVAGWRRLPLSYSLYALALMLPVLLVPITPTSGFLDPLESSQRFVLEVFPAFMTLGLLVRRPSTHQAIIILFTGMLAVLSLVFITGRWLV